MTNDRNQRTATYSTRQIRGVTFSISGWRREQRNVSTYNTDFYAWTLEQAQRLKTGQWEDLDIENLVEEIESLGRREKRELRNRLRVLLGHLLKWQYQPEQRSNSWRSTVKEQRRRIMQHLEENPSLQPYLQEAFQLGYEDGVDLAVQETNLPEETFPTTCPYTLEQTLDAKFLPAKGLHGYSDRPLELE